MNNVTCPRCLREFDSDKSGTVSRADNITPICHTCGTIEALIATELQRKKYRPVYIQRVLKYSIDAGRELIQLRGTRFFD